MSAVPTAAPYGRACNNCAKAKCKCILRNAGGPCERCLRLHKECQPAPSIRKKPGRKAISKTAQLQEKLDDLVTLLRSSANTRAAADTLLQQGPTVQPESGGLSEASEPAGGLHSAESGPGAPNVSVLDQAAAYASPISVSSAYGDVSPFEAEECLELFRSHKLKYFQFVHIPSTVSATQLREERPFLWLSILAATVKSASRQQAFGIMLRNMIAEKVVAQHQRSFDILLGLLGFIGWMTYHLGPHPFMTMYSHLAIAMVQDLGIDKPPPRPCDAHPMACVKSHGFILKVPPSPVRTMEERRAVLACYLATASISRFLRRTLTMPWNGHLDECLRVLDEEQETPLDCVLVQQVKLQRIADSAPSSIMTDVEMSVQPRLTRDFQTKALLSKLEETKQSLRPDLPADLALICHLHAVTTEAEINEVALWPAGSQGSTPDPQRINMLSRCLQLTKTWFDEFLMMPLSEPFMVGFPTYSQLAYFTVVIYRLSTLEDPYWDRIAVKQTLNALQLLDDLTAKMMQVPAACGIISDRPDGDTFSKTSRAIEPIKAAWAPVLAQAQGGRPVGDVVNEQPVIGNFSFDVVDGFNGWLADMFTPGWDAIP